MMLCGATKHRLTPMKMSLVMILMVVIRYIVHKYMTARLIRCKIVVFFSPLKNHLVILFTNLIKMEYFALRLKLRC